MDSEDSDTAIFNALASSAMAEVHRLVCVAADALARDEARECASALTATHQLISQLEQNVTERWMREAADDANVMRDLIEQKPWDDSDEGPTAPENN